MICNLPLDKEEKFSVFYELGDVYFWQNDFESAIKYFTKALANATDSKEMAKLNYNLGMSHIKNGNDSKAVSYFENVLKNLKDKSSSLYETSSFKIADHYYKIRKNDKALAQYESVVKNSPNSEDVPYALFQIGNIYKKDGLFEKAIAAYDRLMKQFPNSYWSSQAKYKREDVLWENEYRDILSESP